MIRFAILAALVAATALPAAAQAPTPRGYHHTAIQHKSVPMKLSNPGRSKGPAAMSGKGCIGPHVNAAQTTINPITGKPQAATIVEVPLGKGAGSVAEATTHAQQREACAKSRAR